MTDSFPELDGSTAAVRLLKDHMNRVARDREVTVLILGESGTGKERVAQAIHRASPRQRGPFIVVNCAALSPTLIEDELFGHVRGAFTGASVERVGPFERANAGTIFLDEIGELSLDLQVKLLRALQQRVIQRLGAHDDTMVDVRVIAATNVDLASAVASGTFRADLYYRLSVYGLRVPPLRERGPDDLRLLTHAIVKRHSARRQRMAPAVDPLVFEHFDQHRWPGNVRELENTLERMIVAAGSSAVLRVSDLPEDFGRAQIDAALEAATRTGIVLRSPVPKVADVRLALQRHAFNRSETARALGLSRHQLYRLLRSGCPEPT